VFDDQTDVVRLREGSPVRFKQDVDTLPMKCTADKEELETLARAERSRPSFAMETCRVDAEGHHPHPVSRDTALDIAVPNKVCVRPDFIDEFRDGSQPRLGNAPELPR